AIYPLSLHDALPISTENAYLGRFAIKDLPNEGKFPVAFRVDESSILRVFRVDPRSGNEEEVALNLSGGLTADDMKRLLAQREARSEEHTSELQSREK